MLSRSPSTSPHPIKESISDLWFDNNNLAVAIMDRDLNYVRVNETYAKGLGKKPSDYVGRNHQSLNPSEAVKEIFLDAIRTRQPYQAFARPFKHAHDPGRGTTYWDWTLTPVLGADDEVELLVLTLLDVTARILAEQQAERTHEHLISVLESMANGFFSLDNNCCATYVNNAALKMTGCSLTSEFLGKSLWELLPSTARTDLKLRIQTAIHERTHTCFEVERTYSPGVWLEVQIHPSPVGASVFISDISSRKKAEIDLRYSAELFSTMFKLGPVMNSIRSAMDGRYIDVNQAWVDGTGYGLDDVVGKTCDDIPLPLSGKCKLTEGMLQTGEGIRNEPIKYRTKDGRTRDGLTSAEVMMVFNEPCLLTVTQDVTEKNAMQDELAKLERLKLIGQMAAGVGHEIRNPLTAIRGFLQLLERKYPESQRQFDIMISEVDRANAIITDFLELAKTRPEKLARHNLNDVVTNSLPTLRSHALASGKDIVLDLQNIPDALLSEGEIRNVLLSLTNNAIEAAYPCTSITIRTAEVDQRVLLKVENQGNNIDPDHLPILGTPFFTTKSHGTGLGLAISYNTAKLHNGHISIRSSNNTTIFTLSIPAAKQQVS